MINIKRIIREKLGDDFEWTSEINPFKPGKIFSEHDVCFNSNNNCKININKDNITFIMDWDSWMEDVDLDADDAIFLQKAIYFGPNYDGDDDWWEFDIDEFNYSYYHITDEQLNDFQKILDITSPGVDITDYESSDSMNRLINYLKYPPLKNLFWKLQDEFLTNIGYAVQRNRWLNTVAAIYREIYKSGANFKFKNGNLWIIIPIDRVFEIYKQKNIRNLSQLIISISSFLTERYWHEWFYDDHDSSGYEDEIEDIFDSFLLDAKKFLNNEELTHSYKKLESMLDNLEFKQIIYNDRTRENTSQREHRYFKENFDDTKWLFQIGGIYGINSLAKLGLYPNSVNIKYYVNPQLNKTDNEYKFGSFDEILNMVPRVIGDYESDLW